jgi:hypothetical protein
LHERFNFTDRGTYISIHMKERCACSRLEGHLAQRHVSHHALSIRRVNAGEHWAYRTGKLRKWVLGNPRRWEDDVKQEVEKIFSFMFDCNVRG